MTKYVCSNCGTPAYQDNVRILEPTLVCDCKEEWLPTGQSGLVRNPLLAHPVRVNTTHIEYIDINKIYDGLWQGALPPAGGVLHKAGYDTLILAASEFQSAESYDDIEVICAPGDDDHRPHRMANFLPIWKDAAKIVVERVRSGKVVLVTCMAGLNRSGMVTAFALQELTGWSGKQCVDHIRTSRKHALCNQTFAQYIIDTYKLCISINFSWVFLQVRLRLVLQTAFRKRNTRPASYQLVRLQIT